MSQFREFPAYFISSSSNININPTVIFCVIGNEFSPGFVNNWTSFLFSLDLVKEKIQPHFVNYFENDLVTSRNKILCSDENDDNEYKNLFCNEWNYDFIFFIDSKIEYFNPNDILTAIDRINKLPNFQIWTHNENSLNNLDLKFTIFRKNIFETLKYPWFEENKNIDKLFIQKLIDMKVKIAVDQTIYVK